MTSDNVEDITVHILRDIRDEIRQTNQRLEGLDTSTKAGFIRLDTRFDNLIETIGGNSRDHEQRITVLEERMKSVEKQSARRRPDEPPRRR
jgi:hypothetical protein